MNSLRTPVIVIFLALYSLGSCRPRPQVTDSLLQAAAVENAESPFQFFIPSAWKNYAVERFRNPSANGRFRLFSFDVSQIAQLSGGFQASINTQNNGVVLRQESWVLGTDLLPGVLLQGVIGQATQPVSIQISGSKEISYTREFSSTSDALMAPVVTPLNLPFTAAKALAMSPGDFVSIPTNMGLALGLEAVAAGRPFGVGAGVGAFWVGEFRFNIYRQDDSYVRIKVAPSSQRGLEMHSNIGARLQMFSFKSGDVINYDRAAYSFLGLDFWQWSRSRVADGERYAFDYLFNLADRSAQIAYNAILEKTLRLKTGVQNLRILPSGVREEVVFSDLTPAEYLNFQDADKPVHQKRVARIFKGADFYTDDRTTGRFGTRALRGHLDRSLTFSKINFVDGTAPNTQTYASAQQYSASHRKSSWVSFFREHANLEAGAFFTRDDQHHHNELIDLHFKWSFGQNDVAKHEFNSIREVYRGILSGLEVEQLGVDSGLQWSDRRSKNFNSDLVIAIPVETVVALQRKLEVDLEGAYRLIDDSLVAVLQRYRSSQSRFDYFRNNLTSTSFGEWGGVDGVFIKPMRQASRSLGQLGVGDFVGEMFKLLKAEHPAGEVLIPAYFLEVAKALRLRPYLSLTESMNGADPYHQEIGSDDSVGDREWINRALYEFTHLGYEG